MLRLLFPKIIGIVLVSMGCNIYVGKAADNRLCDTMPGDTALPDRLHFQFDRAAYGAGEMIWFKVYLKQGFLPLTQSKDLYIDLIDDAGKRMEHEILPVSESGVSAGHFVIPKEYKGLKLHVVAYTRWLLNFGSARLYERTLPVLQSTRPAEQHVGPTPTVAIRFLPEGGQMISGVETKIAFIAMNAGGVPAVISGYIRDREGRKLVDFHTMHQGMGYLMLTPDSGEVYSAVWHSSNGQEQVTVLSPVLPSGVGLNITDTTGGKAFTLIPSMDLAPDLQTLHVVGTMHGQVVYSANARLLDGSLVSGFIPTKGFHSGGLVVTLYTGSWIPLAERVSFVNNMDADTFAVKLSMEKIDVSKRGMNQVLLELPDSNIANLSVSVTDAALWQDTARACSIFSDLLLADDIKGRIYNAASYFRDNTPSSAANIDLVMLTHGWRKFNTVALNAGRLPYERDSIYRSLSGKLEQVSARKMKGLKDLFILTKRTDGVTQSMVASLDEQGRFRLPQVLLFDSVKVYFRLPAGLRSSDKAKLVLSSFNDPQPDQVDPQLLDAGAPATDTGTLAYDHHLVELNKEWARVLSGITVMAKKKSQLEKMDDFYVNNQLFKGSGAMASYSLDVSHDKSAIAYRNILDYIQGRIPGLLSDGGGVYFSGDRSTVIHYATVFVDEMAGTDPAAVSISDIAYVKAFPAPFAGAPMNGSAIVIYTKKGSELEEQDTDTLSYAITHGYANVRQFYSPDYEQKDSLNKSPDTRATIYWSPVLLTNPSMNKVRFSFFNNDLTQSFRIVVEGMDVDGKMTRVERIVPGSNIGD